MEVDQILKAVKDNFEFLGEPTARIEVVPVDYWDEPIVRIRNNHIVISFGYDRRDRVLLPTFRSVDVQLQFDNAKGAETRKLLTNSLRFAMS